MTRQGCSDREALENHCGSHCEGRTLLQSVLGAPSSGMRIAGGYVQVVYKFNMQWEHAELREKNP